MSAFFLSPESWRNVWSILTARRLGSHWSAQATTAGAANARSLSPEDAAVYLAAVRRASAVPWVQVQARNCNEQATHAAAVFLLLWESNRAAVAGRYEKSLGDIEADAVHGLADAVRRPDGRDTQPAVWVADRAALVQSIKTLECLHYQCHEDPHRDGADAHRVGVAMLDAMIAALCRDMVHAEPSYDAAKWG